MSVDTATNAIGTFRDAPALLQLSTIGAVFLIAAGPVLIVLGGAQSSLLISVGIYLSMAFLMALLPIVWSFHFFFSGDSE